jgi:hypothetical protein
MNSSLGHIKYKNSLFVYFILLIIPFIQLGLTYYFSVSFLTFILFFIISFDVGIANKKVIAFTLFSLMIFFTKSLLVSISDHDIRNSFIPFREAFCFIGIVLFSNKLAVSKFNHRYILGALGVLILSIGVMVIMQKISISHGKYLGFPMDFFAMNKSTLESAALALQTHTKFRPTAFYGEPSYAGWVIFSLLAVFLKFSTRRNGLFMIIICLIITLLLQTFAGTLSVLLYSIFWLSKIDSFSLDALNKLLKSLIWTFFTFVILFLSSSSFNERINKILDLNDTSIYIRLFLPLNYFLEMLKKNEFFGVNNFSELSIDNAAWALLIQYGILAFIIIYLFMRYVNNGVLSTLYILLALNFNGALFSFDKAILMSLVIGLHKNSLINQSNLKFNSKYEYKYINQNSVLRLSNLKRFYLL